MDGADKNHDGEHAWREDGACGIAFCTATLREPDKEYGDACEAGMGSCYICGDPRDHDGLPHGLITRKQFDVIRARVELDVIEDLMERVYVNRTLLVSRQRTLKRRVAELEAENHG